MGFGSTQWAGSNALHLLLVSRVTTPQPRVTIARRVVRKTVKARSEGAAAERRSRGRLAFIHRGTTMTRALSLDREASRQNLIQRFPTAQTRGARAYRPFTHSRVHVKMPLTSHPLIESSHFTPGHFLTWQGVLEMAYPRGLSVR